MNASLPTISILLGMIFAERFVRFNRNLSEVTTSVYKVAISQAQEEINRAEEVLKDIGQSGFTRVESMLQVFLDTCF